MWRRYLQRPRQWIPQLIFARGGSLRVVLVLALLCAGGGIAAGQAVVLHEFSSPNPNPQLQNVLYLAAGIALRDAGLSSALKVAKPDYILATDYSMQDGQVAIHYVLSAASASAKALARQSAAIPVGNSFDAEVAAAIRQLLNTANITAGNTKDAQIHGLLPDVSANTPGATGTAGISGQAGATEPPGAAGAPGSAGATAAAGSNGATSTTGATGQTGASNVASGTGTMGVSTESGPKNGTGSSAAAGAVPTVSETPLPAPESPPVSNAPDSALPRPEVGTGASGSPGTALRFQLSSTAGGIAFFGSAADYFHYGLVAALAARVSWERAAWSISAGVRASGIREFNDAGVVGGPLYIAVAGPEVSFGSGADQSYLLGVDISGGAALIAASKSGSTFATVAPYAGLGAELGVRIHDDIAFGLEMRFVAVLTDRLLIMGVSPSFMFRLAI